MQGYNTVSSKSIQRQKFEADAFPHLEALWGTALWLTTRWSKAESLVLETVAHAYEVWDSPNGAVGTKARLFKILIDEYSEMGGGQEKKSRLFPRAPIPSQANESCDDFSARASISRPQLGQLARISHVTLKGAIARHEVPVRLFMVLRFRERFAYREIAYITGTGESRIKSILSHHRRAIPRELVLRVETVRSEMYGGANNGIRTALSLEQ